MKLLRIFSIILITLLTIFQIVSSNSPGSSNIKPLSSKISQQSPVYQPPGEYSSNYGAQVKESEGLYSPANSQKYFYDSSEFTENIPHEEAFRPIPHRSGSKSYGKPRASTYQPRTGYYKGNYHPNDYYQYPEKGSRSSPVSSSSYLDYYLPVPSSFNANNYPAEPEPTASDKHGYSSHGHGHGWGWGWGHEKHSKISNKAVGLLGLLGLLSLLQNVLNSISSTGAPTAAPAPTGQGRLFKREIKMEENENYIDRICTLALPSLAVVAKVQEGKLPLNCTHQDVCHINRILIEELGSEGTHPGITITSVLGKQMGKVAPNKYTHFQIEHSLSRAGQIGRNKSEGDCEAMFPISCKDLSFGKKVYFGGIDPTIKKQK